MIRLARGALAVTMGISATGCTAWRPQSVPPAQLVADPKVEVLRVINKDSTTFFVYQPKMAGDTLTGHPSPTAIQRIAIPSSDITQVATRYKHIGKTLLAALAIGGGIVVYALLQSLNSQP
jgi:hypothetical protein